MSVSSDTSALPSPAATRSRRRGWRDPRLAFGMGLVAVCGLLGARLFAAADDTVAVWALRSDAIAGTPVTADALEPVRVRFADSAAAGAYVEVSGGPLEGSLYLRDVAAGELLPRQAVGSPEASDRIEVPVTVPGSAVPATLGRGDVIDVWVAPREGGEAVAALRGVRVLALSELGSALTPSADRQVIVGLDGQGRRDLPRALSLLAGGSVVISRQGSR